MISVESLVIVLFVIVTLLVMGVWGCIRIIIGLKMERNIVIRQLKLATDTGDDLRSGHVALSKEHLALTIAKDEQDGDMINAWAEIREMEARWEDMNAKLCLAQDRLAVARSELVDVTKMFDDAHQGWKECSEQLDIESCGLAAAQDTIEAQAITIGLRQDTIDDLKAEIAGEA